MSRPDPRERAGGPAVLLIAWVGVCWARPTGAPSSDWAAGLTLACPAQVSVVEGEPIDVRLEFRNHSTREFRFFLYCPQVFVAVRLLDAAGAVVRTLRPPATPHVPTLSIDLRVPPGGSEGAVISLHEWAWEIPAGTYRVAIWAMIGRDNDIISFPVRVCATRLIVRKDPAALARKLERIAGEILNGEPSDATFGRLSQFGIRHSMDTILRVLEAGHYHHALLSVVRGALMAGRAGDPAEVLRRLGAMSRNDALPKPPEQEWREILHDFFLSVPFRQKGLATVIERHLGFKPEIEDPLPAVRRGPFVLPPEPELRGVPDARPSAADGSDSEAVKAPTRAPSGAVAGHVDREGGTYVWLLVALFEAAVIALLVLWIALGRRSATPRTRSDCTSGSGLDI